MEGARRLMAELAGEAQRPALCVVGEPTLMHPVVGHKGRYALRVGVRGRAGHSSSPQRGVNAVEAAAEAIVWVARAPRRRAAEGPFVPAFDPPFMTSQVGTVHGGAILNIIPETAEFTVEWRPVPGEDAPAEAARLRAFVAAEIEPAMRAVDPAAGFTFETLCDVPSMTLDPDHELVALVQRLIGANGTANVSYGTEGGVYQGAGMVTIVCGPGSIEQAHRPDEWIAESELDACSRFVRRLAQWLEA